MTTFCGSAQVFLLSRPSLATQNSPAKNLTPVGTDPQDTRSYHGNASRQDEDSPILSWISLSANKRGNDRRAFRGSEILDAPVIAPGILTSMYRVWVAFRVCFRQCAKGPFHQKPPSTL